MPIAGIKKLRENAFSAAQSALGTAATPSGRVPWSGVPDIDPHWSDIEDADVGSIDPVLDPYRIHQDITVPLEGVLDYDRWQLLASAGIRGGVSPSSSGTTRTWTHQGLSTSATTPDFFSAQFGDDFGQDDIKVWDGFVEEIELTIPDDLGPWRVSSQWYFGSGSPWVTKATTTQLPSNLPLVFGADTQLFIDSLPGSIGSTQISDALHGGRITIRNTWDKKRFANGSNSRFALAGVALAMREVEAEFTFAKTTAISGFSSSELRNVLNADPVTRYLKVLATAAKNIPGSSTPYSLDIRLPLTWRKPNQAEHENNTAWTLSGKSKSDGSLGYAIRTSVVNGHTALP